MEMLAALRALADENRLKIMALLEVENFCVQALAHRLGLSEAAVSQHLKILREAGLVEGEKRSYWVHYRVKNDNLSELTGMLDNISEEVDIEAEIARDPGDECCH